MKLLDEIRTIVSSVSGANPETIMLDMKLRNDLHLADGQLFELCARLEEKYDFDISDDQFEHLQRVGDMYLLVSEVLTRN